MLTESGTQAIDLLCRFLLEPGDTVLIDEGRREAALLVRHSQWRRGKAMMGASNRRNKRTAVIPRALGHQVEVGRRFPSGCP